MKSSGFGQRLKELLQQKQLTLTQVAKSLGISTPSVHRWTNGGEIEYANLRALAAFLDVNWVWLRYGDEAIQDLKETLVPESGAQDLRQKYLGQIIDSEARMKLAYDAARIATWEWQVLTRELTTSPDAEQIFGKPLEAIRPDLLPFEPLPLDRLVAQFADGGEIQEWDFCMPGTDAGSGQGEGIEHDERWLSCRGQLIYDAARRPLKIVGVCIDITQRKAMEKALRRSEYMMRKVIETIPVGLWIADESGHIRIANPEAERIWGGARLVELAHYGEYKGRWESTGKEVGGEGWTLARAILSGEASRGEIVNIDAFDGQQRSIVMSAIPLLDDDGRIIGAIEVNQDITSLKQAEASRGRSEYRWRAMFDQPMVGIAWLESGSDILHANARLAELTELSGEVLARQALASLFDEATGKSLRKHLKSAEARGTREMLNIAGRVRRASGPGPEVLVQVVSQGGGEEGVFRTLVFVSEMQRVG
ncbi:helix-turn-helix domain-containing protein [Paraburkholderia tagetis]|uniref:histidine kinase n=1 Tax=Paraburkholderia tagetis TaxID=2913261 RepID=A0A9X1ULI7_9BURK|nr:helix-turn-helix transcriptional regulator [Paraburkholderia tagetis]MCG5077482.1 PAS domain-containing protein [Paraburkholderia tagetis]